MSKDVAPTLALPLDTPEQPHPPQRPAYGSALAAAARALLPDVRRWLGGSGDPHDPAVISALVDAWSDDGYAMAKRLDDSHCWFVDAALVEILDNASVLLAEAHEAAVRAWVAANGIRPRYAVGDRVSTPRGDGEISAVRADTAEYLVLTSEHVAKFGRAGGSIVAFEVCVSAIRCTEAE